MKQSRLKSPVLWGACASIVLLILQHFGLEGSVAAGEQVASSIFQLICGLLALFGIANDPTNKTGF